MPAHVMGAVSLAPVRVIHGDDLDAIPKLEARLRSFESQHRKMLSANRNLLAGNFAALAADGWSPDQIAELQRPFLKGRIGFPPAQISNCRKTVQRLRERIRTLEKVQGK